MTKENGAAESESGPAAQVRGGKLNQAEFLETLRASMPADEGDADKVPGDDAQDDNGDDGEELSKRKAKPKKPKDLTAAAESLGLKVEDLYAIEIPSAKQGEKPYTLGALKDLAATQDDFSVRSLKLDSDRRAFERERVTAETELREIMANLPEDALKPAALTKLRSGIEARHAREREAIVRSIPEWADESVRLQELREMVEHLKGYGVPETFLMEHFDHRTMLFVRDAMRIQKAVDKALSEVKERRGNNRATSQARGQERRGKAEAQADSRQTRQVRGFFDTIAAAARER